MSEATEFFERKLKEIRTEIFFGQDKKITLVFEGGYRIEIEPYIEETLKILYLHPIKSFTTWSSTYYGKER